MRAEAARDGATRRRRVTAWMKAPPSRRASLARPKGPVKYAPVSSSCGTMKKGDEAPDFELPADDGSTVSLGSFRGKKNVVLCFYPKNRLFGCPSKKVFEMAESMVSAYPEIQSTGTVVLAISSDTVADQARFVREWGVPYRHLSDTTKEVCRRYAGLNMARLARRSTFVVDRDGVIQGTFRGFDAATHGTEVLELLRGLN